MDIAKTSSRPLVSVIMPAYNVDRFISQSIESILNQTYSNWELLICDDGSTDKSVRIMENFQDFRIRLFQNSKNLGITMTTNLLLGQALGEFIVLQDADDWSESNRIERLLQSFDNESSDYRIGIVSSGVTIHYKNDITKTRIYPLNLDRTFLKSYSSDDLPCTCASMCFRRKVLDDVGLYDTFFNRIGSADYDFVYRSFLAGYSMAQIPEVLYHVRRSENSFTRRFHPHPFRYISPQIARFIFEKRLKNGLKSVDTSESIFEKEVERHFNIDDGYAFFRYSESLYFGQKWGLALWYAFMAFVRAPSTRYIKNFINILIARY